MQLEMQDVAKMNVKETEMKLMQQILLRQADGLALFQLDRANSQITL